MLTYTFDPAGACLYEQLYDFIRTDILRGSLKSGERLPSKRKLAEHLQVSVITVENAYNQLIAEGYIQSQEKRGYFVARMDEALPAPEKRPEVTVPPEKSWFMDFKTNHISGEQFPFSVWAKLMRAQLLEQDKQLLQPQKYNGVPELRGAIADYLYHARGMSVHPEQILIGSGTEYLYNLIIQLLGRDKVYAVEDPGYQKIASIYRVNDAAYRPIRMDREGLSVRQLRETDVDVVHLSPSHHFPTGLVTPITRRQELLKWANEKPGRYIIEDDYDSEFRFSGRPIPTLFSIDEQEKVLYINTFSKTIAPSIRISYLILPPSLLALYREKLGFYACTVPSFEQYTLARFLSRGYFEKHINRMRKFYKNRRNRLIGLLEGCGFSRRLTILEQDAGLHFLVKVNTALTDRELTEGLARAGVRVRALSEYYHDGSPDLHCLVVNYSGLEEPQLEQALNRLEQALRAL